MPVCVPFAGIPAIGPRRTSIDRFPELAAGPFFYYFGGYNASGALQCLIQSAPQIKRASRHVSSISLFQR